MSPRSSLYFDLLYVSETLLNRFFSDEVSQLLLGQRTGNTTQLKAGSEDSRTHCTAEHIKTWDSLSFSTGTTLCQNTK